MTTYNIRAAGDLTARAIIIKGSMLFVQGCPAIQSICMSKSTVYIVVNGLFLVEVEGTRNSIVVLTKK